LQRELNLFKRGNSLLVLLLLLLLLLLLHFLSLKK
jgi:hypothetical protein